MLATHGSLALWRRLMRTPGKMRSVPSGAVHARLPPGRRGARSLQGRSRSSAAWGSEAVTRIMLGNAAGMAGAGLPPLAIMAFATATRWARMQP
jgi:hypothetical protein